jgi:hypothetical protein
LDAVATALSWSDGPEILVGLRNALVHPTVEKRRRLEVALEGVFDWAYFEASALSLWYLELLLLSLFDYRGEYSNRLVLSGFRGQEVERVPWLEKGSDISSGTDPGHET